MTSERHRCRVLRRPIEALELAGDPAPTTPRCLSTSGAGGSPSKAPHIITTIAAAPRTSCGTLRARHDLVIVAELSGFSGMHPDAGGKASSMTPPGAWCVRGSGCRTCRRDHGLPEPTIGFGSTGRAACRSAHLGAGGTPCSTARTACDRRLEVVGVGRRVAGPVDRRTIPRSKSAGDTGGAVALPSAWLPQRTLGYSGARGMVRDGQCTVEHTPIAAGRQLADD